MRKWTLFVIALLWAAPVAAQTHPCDVAAPANPIVQNPYRVQFCWDLRDLDGSPLLPSEVQVRVTVDGSAQPLRALPAPIGPTSATGFNLYEIGGQVAAKGAHAVIVGIVSVDGEGISPPFGFTVRGKAPKAPAARVVQ